MPKRKRMNEIKAAGTRTDNFVEQAASLCAGLYYMSETDAEIKPFAGQKAGAVSVEEILRQTKAAAGMAVEERNFAEIFARLTEIQDWYGEEEKATAEKFERLNEFLERNLRDLKVFKVGSRRLKIYFVGLDREDRLMGIQTEAVET